ncbi:MAG: LOW QUALITY PROTEIN: hypothetical protein J3R72DRAFT_425548 [Linnemannia gamsii]|nr:MAG: LOW QUALITY PROTEIN: hypothetical protein J3R72DRAFT_425548 [Linnemannia gamsii]
MSFLKKSPQVQSNRQQQARLQAASQAESNNGPAIKNRISFNTNTHTNATLQPEPVSTTHTDFNLVFRLQTFTAPAALRREKTQNPDRQDYDKHSQENNQQQQRAAANAANAKDGGRKGGAVAVAGTAAGGIAASGATPAAMGPNTAVPAVNVGTSTSVLLYTAPRGPSPLAAESGQAGLPVVSDKKRKGDQNSAEEYPRKVAHTSKASTSSAIVSHAEAGDGTSDLDFGENDKEIDQKEEKSGAAAGSITPVLSKNKAKGNATAKAPLTPKKRVMPTPNNVSPGARPTANAEASASATSASAPKGPSPPAAKTVRGGLLGVSDKKRKMDGSNQDLAENYPKKVSRASEASTSSATASNTGASDGTPHPDLGGIGKRKDQKEEESSTAAGSGTSDLTKNKAKGKATAKAALIPEKPAMPTPRNANAGSQFDANAGASASASSSSATSGPSSPAAETGHTGIPGVLDKKRKIDGVVRIRRRIIPRRWLVPLRHQLLVQPPPTLIPTMARRTAISQTCCLDDDENLATEAEVIALLKSRPKMTLRNLVNELKKMLDRDIWNKCILSAFLNKVTSPQDGVLVLKEGL